MLNQFITVGRIINDLSNDNNIVTIAVTRNYKNENGEFETDLIDILIQGIVAEKTMEYCKKGDIIGVKGYIRSEVIDNIRKVLLVAERITFLSSKKDDIK